MVFMHNYTVLGFDPISNFDTHVQNVMGRQRTRSFHVFYYEVHLFDRDSYFNQNPDSGNPQRMFASPSILRARSTVIPLHIYTDTRVDTIDRVPP